MTILGGAAWRVFRRPPLRLSPDLLPAPVELGKNLVELGQWDEAIEHLSRAVRLAPQEVSPEYYLGLAYQRRGTLGQAVAHYKKVFGHQSAVWKAWSIAASEACRETRVLVKPEDPPQPGAVPP
jgi:tetratricopeptide (TPR) repeat protein